MPCEQAVSASQRCAFSLLCCVHKSAYMHAVKVNVGAQMICQYMLEPWNGRPRCSDLQAVDYSLQAMELPEAHVRHPEVLDAIKMARPAA